MLEKKSRAGLVFIRRNPFKSLQSVVESCSSPERVLNAVIHNFMGLEINKNLFLSKYIRRPVSFPYSNSHGKAYDSGL